MLARPRPVQCGQGRQSGEADRQQRQPRRGTGVLGVVSVGVEHHRGYEMRALHSPRRVVPAAGAAVGPACDAGWLLLVYSVF